MLNHSIRKKVSLIVIVIPLFVLSGCIHKTIIKSDIQNANEIVQIHNCELIGYYTDTIPPPIRSRFYEYRKNRNGELTVYRKKACSATSNITVNYTGFTSQAQTAFQFAVDIWETIIDSNVDIVINANFANLGNNVLGSAGPRLQCCFTGGVFEDTWYPQGLINCIGGSDFNGATHEISASFSNTFPFYFGTDGNAGGSFDFVTVVLHEIGHGLGFTGAGDVSGGIGTYTLGPYPLPYDHFVQNGTGTGIMTFTDSTAALATQLTSNNLFFSGTNTNAANGNAPAKIYSPNAWNDGSSYSHLDETTFNGTNHALMTYAVAAGEVIHDPGAVTMSIFKDQGWSINPCALSSCPSSTILTGNLSGTYQADTLTLAANSILTGNTILQAEEIIMNGPFETQTFTLDIENNGCP